METSENKTILAGRRIHPLLPRAGRISAAFILLAATGLLASWLVPETTFQAALENEFIKHLKKKLDTYNAHLPEDRLYVQTDKPLYEPGDDIWLSAFIRDGIS